MPDKKFISPGAWFSLVYPQEWSEFEDAEGSFLFYNPDSWSGNFRISAYKKEAKFADANAFGKDSVRNELKKSPSSSLVRIGNLECAYSKEMFMEDGAYYVSHIWITGIENVAFECSFTLLRGKEATEAEEIIKTLEIRRDGQKYPAEIIPVRISEINEVNEGYEWIVSAVKKQLKKDFQGNEDDLSRLKQLVDSGVIGEKQRDAWLAVGIAICVILTNEVDGMEWVTLIDGNREAPVLQYRNGENIIDPMRLAWSKIKAGEPCDVVKEYKHIIENL